LWTRRKRLVLAVVALFALLAVAAGARFAIGAIAVRVVPSSMPSARPLDPAQLGRPAAVSQVAASVGFDVALPAGRTPDAAYVSRSGDDAAIFAWKPDGRSPALPGTPWGLVLIELTSAPGEELVKVVSGFQDTGEIALDGHRAFWIHRPHELLVITDEGDERFLVEGNVLIWERAGVTYRLETPLALEDAIAIARTIA